jgi:tyrosine-protein phosphatase SIW14
LRFAPDDPQLFVSEESRLRTILFLGPDDYPETSAHFLQDNAITLICVAMEGNRAPLKTIPPEQMVQALKHIPDIRNQPIHVHCDKGTHMTGTVIGCLRKLQNWPLVSIFEGHRSFAGAKTKQIDEQCIELFEPPVSRLDRTTFPPWLRHLRCVTFADLLGDAAVIASIHP